MPVFVRKLFGIGKLPADVRAAAEAEGLIYLADFVPVTRRFSGAIPAWKLSSFPAACRARALPRRSRRQSGC